MDYDNYRNLNMPVDAQIVAYRSLQIHYRLIQKKAVVEIGPRCLYLGFSVLAVEVGVAFTVWIITVLMKKNDGYQFL